MSDVRIRELERAASLGDSEARLRLERELERRRPPPVFVCDPCGIVSEPGVRPCPNCGVHMFPKELTRWVEVVATCLECGQRCDPRVIRCPACSSLSLSVPRRPRCECGVDRDEHGSFTCSVCYAHLCSCCLILHHHGDDKRAEEAFEAMMANADVLAAASRPRCGTLMPNVRSRACKLIEGHSGRHRWWPERDGRGLRPKTEKRKLMQKRRLTHASWGDR